MDENYIKMMRQSLKSSGMSDEQIEATLAAQKAAMEQYAGLGMENLAGAMMDPAKIHDMMESDSYFEFAEKPSIDKSYQWAVACGADLIHLRADVINDLSSGTDKETCKETLSEQWGIDTKKDFTEMAESLKAGRHSVVYQKLAEGKTVKDLEEEAGNLKEAKKVFKRDKLIGDKVPNMLIWDLGRLINISRWAFDAGLITRKAALAYLKDAALAVKKEYKSWKDLSIGYQFGRAVWGGLEQYEDLKEGMQQLLTEKDSPWVTLSFTLPLKFDD
jgi:hypothetical protein